MKDIHGIRVSTVTTVISIFNFKLENEILKWKIGSDPYPHLPLYISKSKIGN